MSDLREAIVGITEIDLGESSVVNDWVKPAFAEGSYFGNKKKKENGQSPLFDRVWNSLKKPKLRGQSLDDSILETMAEGRVDLVGFTGEEEATRYTDALKKYAKGRGEIRDIEPRGIAIKGFPYRPIDKVLIAIRMNPARVTIQPGEKD